MSGEWRPGSLSPAPAAQPRRSSYTLQPPSPCVPLARGPVLSLPVSGPLYPRSWPLVTCTFLECRVQALLVP